MGPGSPAICDLLPLRRRTPAARGRGPSAGPATTQVITNAGALRICPYRAGTTAPVRMIANSFIAGTDHEDLSRAGGRRLGVDAGAAA